MSEKTIADVLDKSIDKLSGGAAEIAKAAKQVAPHAWEVAVRQQVAEGVAGVFLAPLVALCVYFAARAAWSRRKELDQACALEVVLTFGGVAGAIVFGVAVHWFYESALQVANPEYAAAKAIIEAVK